MADASKYIADVCNAYSTQSERIACFKENELDFADMLPVEKNKVSPDKVPSNPEKPSCALKNCDPHLYWQAVEVVCPDVIESLAKWDYEWTDGWLDFKFDTQHYKTNQVDVFRFRGNKLKLQNGFGAWANVTYYCDVDFISGKIINAGVE
ncbi:MAG: hypothetical protein WEB02_03140 [Methylophaga sp.]